ncbi:RagB/SusD family nutrient uptake outer membrane protein [Porphyromonas pogonae]|uniref:RagB/SusD family nutrient uptake outer membrane protein n=1 Tax=Porphyromonas pogonae TaxID=867595 RepID=UPI002E77DA10|nr:RagB/SusD family nutrient uptake outer membrane protein [Porphyromonas pogonae]
MIRLKNYIALGAVALITASCSLDTVPHDALPGNTVWTENEAQKFAVGCYDGWEKGPRLLYWDCTSDFGYNQFSWEGYNPIGNGTISPSNPGVDMYNFTMIRRCNEFMGKIGGVKFAEEGAKKDLTAQVRLIRAYNYFILNWNYGGVPIIGVYNNSEEAKVPRETEANVRAFIEKELDAIVPELKATPAELGRMGKGAALALRMRQALYYGDWATAKDRARKIMDLNVYNLEPVYSDIFTLKGKKSREIILAVEYIPNTKPLSKHTGWGNGEIGSLYNNGFGGWSCLVPTKNLVDTYEMANGLTIHEPQSGFDATHPFKGRDPRMAMTIEYPGCNFITNDGSTVVLNTLDKEINGKANPNFPTAADNSSKTALSWAKYTHPMTQYADIWSTGASPIVFRYAEVLLTFAEASNELAGPSNEVYQAIDAVRKRAGMPAVDKAKYASKETLRELIHRERGVEFAGEGLRRDDLLRWKTADGKLLAEKALNGVLERYVGTVNASEKNPELRATINVNASPKDKKIEDRSFKPHNRFLPIPQSALDNNPKLKQNTGY